MTARMWWIIFTAVDLYIGLVVLKSLEPSLPPAKQRRVAVAAKVIVGLLVLCVIALVVVALRRR